MAGNAGQARRRTGRTGHAGRSASRPRVPDFPPQVLRDYAVLADGRRAALIGSRGDIGWLCFPRWDSPAVFARLIGGRGIYAVAPAEDFVWGGYYEPGGLIWRSRWVTTSTTLECREALAYPAEAGRAVLLRRIEAHESPARVDVTLALSADYGRASRQSARRSDDGEWLLRAGDVHARWTGAAEAVAASDGSLMLSLTVPPHSTHDLVLELFDGELAEKVVAEQAWTATESAWDDAVPDFVDSAAPRDSRHAYAVLRGLTQPGGGMVAAATLGLPERAQAGRNYDYRYVWLRDQAYAGLAAGVTEPLPLLDEAVAFSTARVLDYGADLPPAYRVDGTLPGKEERLELPSYPGGSDVIGNWVRSQFQLDSLGELLQLYAVSARHDHLRSEDAKAIRTVVDLIERRWPEPDAGIWELEDAWWTHSRLACVAGLRSLARHLPAGESARASTLADTIMAETSRRCLDPDGAWLQRPDRSGTDAALLLPPVRGAGALDPADPRILATLRAVDRELVEDGYVYRYRAGGMPLGQAEGAFLLCGFVKCLAELGAGHVLEAVRTFERQRAACGPAGLFAEEFDVRQRQLRGNLPQGFVHAMLLECSQRLSRVAG